MNGKSALQSKTIIGVIMLFLAQFVDLAPQLSGILTFTPQGAKILQSAVAIAGAILAIYGRLSAADEITGILAPKVTEKQP